MCPKAKDDKGTCSGFEVVDQLPEYDSKYLKETETGLEDSIVRPPGAQSVVGPTVPPVNEGMQRTLGHPRSSIRWTRTKPA